ncbi:hypothetical protein PV392_08265 [Streptomyces sp. ME03-5709C]|nr:hypothetical protein [Streptomyces sp. ME03-5709C]
MTTQTSAAPRVLSLIPADPGWVATVYYGEQGADGRRTITGTERHSVHGWALVEMDGTSSIEPMYVESPGLPTCASLRNSYAPDRAEVYTHFDPAAADLTEPRLAG